MAWSDDVLAQLRAPDSDSNKLALQLWARSEGTPPAWNNWLATTYDGFGGVKVNSVGVKQYPTEADGVQATVATLKLGYYRAVVYALLGDEGLAAIYHAINQSPWCGGCSGGKYPIALWERVSATVADPTHVPGPPENDIRVTDARPHPNGGVYILGADGGVFALHGAPFFGSYPGLPEDARQGDRGVFTTITVKPDGSGYTLTDEHGENYTFPVGP